jgi:TonB family protein
MGPLASFARCGHNRARQIDTTVSEHQARFRVSGVSNLSSFSEVIFQRHAILPIVFLLVTAVFAVGQSTGTGEDASTVNPVLRRIERARALAAVHQLKEAATELENIRASANDITLRNVSTLMLIGIYLEEGVYGRSQALLEETFAARGSQKDESIRTYFAAAGQTLNGIRTRLARYRSYGINPGDTDLSAEANGDLERVRALLERVIAQAKEVSQEAGRSYDALALQEDALGIRLSIARNNDDRAKWQTEYLLAREKLASSQVQVASLGRSPALDAVTNRIPNPFATSPSPKSDSNSSDTPASTSATSTSASGPEPQLVSTGSLGGRETKRITPVYPAQARAHNITGTVRVFAIVDENGKIWVTNSEGPTLLRKAAEDAARGWTFPPSTVNGKPVRLAGYLDFDFKL